MAKLILVAGSGHAHNEFVNWLVNQNVCAPNAMDNCWQLYPGQYGTFIRHDDSITYRVQYPEIADLYDDELRYSEDNHTKKWQFNKLIEEVDKMYDDDTIVCQYFNCLNPEEVAEWAEKANIPILTSIIDLPNSSVRSHYLRMQYSDDAAESVDYSVQHDIKSMARWLYHVNIFQQKVATIDNIVKVNVNQFFDTTDEDQLNESLKNIFVQIGLPEKVKYTFVSDLNYFKQLNITTHPDMVKFDQMDWDTLSEIAFPIENN